MKRIIKFRCWDNDKMINTNNITTDLPLMQYTGINDFLGNEIYEGDIVIPVKFKDIPNIVIYLGNGFYRFKKHNEKEYYNELGNCQVKVIGNIFQQKTIKK